MIFYTKNIKHTYLHCGQGCNNTTLFGEKRVIFALQENSNKEDVIDNGQFIRNSDSGKESYIDSENIGCDLDAVRIGMKRDTDKKILTCRQHSNLGVLQYEVENLPDEEFPEFPSETKTEVETENVQQSEAVHKNAHVIEKKYHAESVKELYETLERLGNVRTDLEYRLFVNVLSEDIAHGEKTGTSLENIQDTWLGNNGENRGVFNALHNKDAEGGGRIKNATFLEYKKGSNAEKNVSSEITAFNRKYSVENKKLKEEANNMHIEFLQNSQSIITEAKKLESSTNLKSEIPNFFRFLKTNIKISPTSQLHIKNNQNIQIKPFVIENSEELVSELKKINILLNDENIQKNSVNTNGRALNDNEKEAMRTYRSVLEKMLESKDLETKKALLTDIQINNNTDNLESKMQTIIENIVLKKKQIQDLTLKIPIDSNKIALLEQDIEYLEKEKEVYSEVQDSVSPLYPDSSVYDDIFENIWKEGKIVGTKVKNMSRTIVDLKNYHKWVGEKMFAGVSVSSNPDVNAVLISSAYRGDISPKSLHSALLQMTHNNKNIAEFYEEVAKVMYSSNDAESRVKFLSYLEKYPEFSAIKDTLVEAAEFWNDDDLAGNKAKFDANNPLVLTEANSRQAFQKNWGFNINLAYKQYKKLNTQKIRPNELDLQNSFKKNTQVLDMSLWITVDAETKKRTVNDSPEMKNYLSQLLLNSLRISSEGNIKQAIENLDITDDKKKLYTQIITKNWSAENADLMVFVQTLKSEFTEEKKIEEQFGIKDAKGAMDDVVKNMNDATGAISESVSYIWDRATSGDLKYVGLVGALAYVMMKDTSGKNSSGLLWLLKRGLWIGGGVAVANSVADDMFDIDVFEKGKELLMGENEKVELSPSGIPLSEMKKIDGVSEDVDSKEFKRAGIALSNGNVKETLDWYNQCKSLKEDKNRKIGADLYSLNLPSGIKHLLSNIYADEGSVGDGHTKEDAAQKVYNFLELYFKHISLQLNPTAGDGLGNASTGYRSIADEFYYPDEVENTTYSEYGTNTLKKGYTMADVMRARTSRESIHGLKKVIDSVADATSIGVDKTGDLANEVIASVSDEERNTKKTDANIG